MRRPSVERKLTLGYQLSASVTGQICDLHINLESLEDCEGQEAQDPMDLVFQRDTRKLISPH